MRCARHADDCAQQEEWMAEPQEFEVELFGVEGMDTAGLRVPFDVPTVWGTRARVPVRGTINGVPFRSSIAPMDGGHMMVVNRAMREAMGVKAGDVVTVVMEWDTAPREVAVPDDLTAGLDADEAAQAGWERASYTRRKEIVRALEEAKTEATRARRLAKALAELAAPTAKGEKGA
jgi:hypothetical protein